MQRRILRDVYGSPVTKPTWWWQMTIIPYWDYHLMPTYQSKQGFVMREEYLLSLRRNLTTNNAALIVSGILAMSRRVRDLTQRLEGHKIEHRRWRYRGWRKTATGCDGLRVLYISIVQLAERQTPDPANRGSSPCAYFDVVTNSI